MRFYDEALVTVESGKGGDGTVAGRREAGVPMGGPSGGNGGKGGSIIFVASKDENTLINFKYRKNFVAKPGEPGRSKDQYGANAEDLILTTPVGTMIRDNISGKVLYVFSKDKEKFTIVKGGEGGVGNMHFKDAVNQFPNFCLLGEPGQKIEIILELQLLADVALIGTPSVGKSTIINSISHTKAKTADYPFTTLVPNLGSVIWREHKFNVIDIPGLIKGAADGKGLGNAFLRHVLKARVFCMIVDIARYDEGLFEINDLLSEIFIYVSDKFQIPEKRSKGNEVSIKRDGKFLVFLAKKDGEIVLEKRIMFIINKYDLVNDEEILGEYKNQLFVDILAFFKEKKISASVNRKILEANTVTISAVSRYGLDLMQDKIIEQFEGLRINEVYHIPDIVDGKSKDSTEKNMVKDVTKIEKEFLLDEGYMEEDTMKYNKVWEIRDPEICRMVWMISWGNEEAENYFWKNMDKDGYLEIFDGLGIHKGDVLKIISYYYGKEDRYILY